MSDPLSVTASIGGLVLLAKEIVQLIASIIETVRGAKEEMQRLNNIVATLYGILKGLRLVLQQLPNTDTISPGKVIFDCSATLEDIRKLLMRCGSGHDVVIGPSARIQAPKPATTTVSSTWGVAKHRAIWLVKKHEVEILIDRLEGHKSTLLLALTQNSLSGTAEILRRQDETLSHLRDMKEAQLRIQTAQIVEHERRLSEERKKVLDKASELCPEKSLQKHLGLRQEGTGKWFLNGDTFEDFKKAANSKLWLYGIPGAGKSVLSAAIIDQFLMQQDEKSAVAFFFCEYGNRSTQKIRQILGSIARQLVLQNPDAFTMLEDFLNTHDGLHHPSKTPNDTEWIGLVQDISLAFNSTTVIIDGLDECLEDGGEIVKTLASLSSRGSIRTLYASREEPHIKEGLEDFKSLPIAAEKADVRLYVAAHLDARFQRMASKDPALRQEILENLVDRSDGMFQWVKCQLDYLEDLPSNRLRRKALTELPPDLPQTYERILHRAIESQREWTLKFMERSLRWITLAKYPLSLPALAEAISMEPTERELDDSLEIESVLRPCSSLIRNVNGTIVFSHFSVKEYLCSINPENVALSRFRVDKEEDEDDLAAVCLSYLLLNDFAALDLRDAESWDIYTEGHPFYGYATDFWFDHAHKSSNSRVLELELELFKQEKSDQFYLWAYHWLPQHTRFEGESDPAELMYDITPLHLACTCRLPHVVDHLLSKGADINRVSAVLGTPIVCTISGWSMNCQGNTFPESEKGLQIVERLISENVSKSKGPLDPLAEATGDCWEDMAALLLGAGFPVTKEALEMAEEFGGQELFDVLITHTPSTSLDPDAEDLFRKFVLDHTMEKIRLGDESIRLEIFAHRVDSDFQEIIRAAASHGRLETVSRLLQHAFRTMPDDERKELLSFCLSDAASNRQSDVLSFLINYGADPSFQRQSDGRTAIHRAIEEGDIEIFCKLLEACQDVGFALNVKDESGIAPWLCAVEAGQADIFKEILRLNPDLDFEYTTALGFSAAHLVMISGNERMFHKLIEQNVDFNLRSASGKTPTHVLLESIRDGTGDEDAQIRILWVIIQQQDLSARNESGESLLHLLVDAGQCSQAMNEVVEKVLEDQSFQSNRERALSSTNSQFQTPLHLSLQNLSANLDSSDSGFQIQQVRLLVNPSSSSRDHLLVKDDNLRTPIIVFAYSISSIEPEDVMRDGFQSVVSETFRVLLEAGQGLNLQDCEGRTAIHYVACSRSGFPFEQVTTAFLEKPIDLAIRDKCGNTPLSAAVAQQENENIDFIKLILPWTTTSDLEDHCGSDSPLIHQICTRPDVEELFPDHLETFALSKVLDKNGFMPLAQILDCITNLDDASELAELIEKSGEICDNTGHTCMYWACRLGANPVVAALVDRYSMVGHLSLSKLDHHPEDSPLIVSAKHQNFDTVRLLLQKGANYHHKSVDGWRLQHYAMVCSDFDSILDLIECGDGFDFETPISMAVKLNYRSIRNLIDATTLHLVASNSNTTALEWLLANNQNLNLNAKTACGMTPLHIAAWHSNLEGCKLLVSAGASLIETDKDGLSPLHRACESRCVPICQYLLSENDQFVNSDFQGKSIVEIAAGNGDVQMVDLLLRSGFSGSENAELYALEAEDLELADLIRDSLGKQQDHSEKGDGTSDDVASSRLRILCQAPDSEAPLLTLIPLAKYLDIRVTLNHETALHVASRRGWTRAVEILADHGASLDVMDNDLYTPLLAAARNGEFECVKILHKRGGDISARDYLGMTGLHLAAMSGNCDTITYFLKEGIDVNAEDNWGYSPIYWSTSFAAFDVLLKNGADPLLHLEHLIPHLGQVYIKERSGECLRRALDGQPQGKVQEFVNRQIYGYKATLLYSHCFRGNIEAVKVLVGYGAEVNQMGGRLGTPIQAAWKQGHFDVASLLLANGAKPFVGTCRGHARAAWYWELNAQSVFPVPGGSWITE